MANRYGTLNGRMTLRETINQQLKLLTTFSLKTSGMYKYAKKKSKAKEDWLRMDHNEDHELALEVLTRWKEQRDNRMQYQDRTKTLCHITGF